jgi:hypothetical protein
MLRKDFARELRVRLYLFLAIAILVPAFPTGASAQDSYELPGENVAIWNLAGSVNVTGGGSAVAVDVRRGGADASRLEIATGGLDLDDLGQVSTLRVVYPGDEIVFAGTGNTEVRVRDDGTFFRGGDDRGRKVKIRESGSGLDAHANLEVRVPRGHTVLVHLAVGEVSVSNVDGDLTVDVGSADVTASGTSGRLLVDTGSGDVEVDGARGDLVVDTGSGDVVARDVGDGDLLIDTGSGDVSGGTISVGSLNVDTGSGAVTLASVTASERRRGDRIRRESGRDRCGHRLR